MTDLERIAQHLELPTDTIRRALFAVDGVSPTQRRQARQAAHTLGIDIATADPRTRPGLVGLVYDNPNAHYLIQVQNAIQKTCQNAAMGVQIHPCDARAPGLGDALVALVRTQRLAGLVLTPPIAEDAALLRTLTRAGVKFSRVISAQNTPVDDPWCVHVQDEAGAYAITRHLIDLGHARIAFFAGNANHNSSAARAQGYRKALADHHISADPQLAFAGEFTFDDGFRRARKLFTLHPRPTAVFCANDEVAAGVLAAAQAVGVDVPYDLSIAGFEDSPISHQCWPTLTTARQAIGTIAACAAERLIARIQGDTAPQTARGFLPELIVRGSTAPPHAADIN